MSKKDVVGQTFRFADFEFNGSRCELRKSGSLRHLQKQPSLALALLLKRAPGIVSRDELASCLWGERKYTDFEDRLNHVLSRLRTALGDPPSASHFIETRHGLGYRFVCPVAAIDSPEVAPRLSAWRPAATARRPRFAWLVIAATGTVLLAGWLGTRALESANDIDAAFAAKSHVAVFPFVNLTGQSDNDLLTQGMFESVVTELTRVGALVISTPQPDHTDSPSDNFDYLMLSTLLPGDTPDSLSLTVRLTTVNRLQTVWSNKFERGAGSIDQFQARASDGIVADVQGLLLRPEEERLALAQPVSAEIEALLAHGRELLDKGLVDDAIDTFNRVIEQHPDRAQPYSDLARALIHMGWFTASASETVMPAAQLAAHQALKLDPSLATPYLVLANAKAFYEWQWQEAEELYRQAIARNQNYAPAYLDYAAYLFVTGRTAEGIEQIDKAEEVDWVSAATQGQAGVLYHYIGEWEQAHRHYELALAIEPDNALWLMNQACTYVFQGEYEKGEALISQVRRTAPNDPAPKVIEAFLRALIEQENSANVLLGEIQYSPLPSLSELMRASIYIALDRKDDALATLEKAYEMRLVALPFTILHPAHAPLRSDPRHQDLLRRIGLRPRTDWSQSNQAAELPDVVALRTH